MKMPTLTLAALFGAAALLGATSANAGEPSTAFDFIANWYVDDKMPLEAETLSTTEKDGITISEVRFRAHDHEWVTGRIAIPANVDAPPVVIALHGITQSRDQWFRMTGPYSFPAHHAQALLEKGIAVFALDARNHGDRIEAGKDFPNAIAYLENGYYEAAFKMIAESAIDVHRAIDYLGERSDVDSDRLGIIGFSLGAHIGWITTAIDERVDRGMLMGMPIVSSQPQRLTEQPLYYPGLAGRPVFLLAAEEDTFYTIEQMQALYDGLSSDKKRLELIGGPHDMPASTSTFAVEFFAEML